MEQKSIKQNSVLACINQWNVLFRLLDMLEKSLRDIFTDKMARNKSNSMYVYVYISMQSNIR